MRFLDTREQKSPRFLVDAFPDIEIKPLTVGDYFSGEKNETCVIMGDIIDSVLPKYQLSGNLVEIKLGKDGEKHTEQLERMQEEFYRMAGYRQKNPYVVLHAVWVPDYKDEEMEDLFNHLCFKYHIWGHIIRRNELIPLPARIKHQERKLVAFLKALDQPAQYKEFEPFIKRSHEEPTDLSRALRIPKGVSSDIAIQLSECEYWGDVKKVKGMILKNGNESKLLTKILGYLYRLTEFYEDVMLGKGESP